MNKVYVIGMGPGAYEQMTVKAVRTLEKCDVIVGYTVYIELLKEYFPDKRNLTTGGSTVQDGIRRGSKRSCNGNGMQRRCRDIRNGRTDV